MHYVCMCFKKYRSVVTERFSNMYILFSQAHMEAVHADWKEYLNLLICEENHLKHMDEYHKVGN